VRDLRITAAILLMLAGIGCVPYPRYNPEAEFTPREQRGNDQFMTSHEYIQLGMILQRQLGRPYAGRSKWEEGVDCSQYTRDAFREFNGLQLPRTVAEQFTQGTEVARSRLRFGDLVFFHTTRERVSHVGVYHQPEREVLGAGLRGSASGAAISRRSKRPSNRYPLKSFHFI
jgi:hypothetical protein